MTSPPEPIQARVGDIVTIAVPNWASAGFQWGAQFDRLALEAIDRFTVAGDDIASGGETRFRFRLLSAKAPLRLSLSRPGQQARETREYLIGTGQPD